MPRFTLRDLFWMVLVVALAIGWWIDHSMLRGLYGAKPIAPPAASP